MSRLVNTFPSCVLLCKHNSYSKILLTNSNNNDKCFRSVIKAKFKSRYINNKSPLVSNSTNGNCIRLEPVQRSISTTALLTRKKDWYEEEKLPIYDYGAIKPDKKRLYVFGTACHGALGLQNLLKPVEEHERKMLYMQRPVRHWFGDQHTLTNIATGHGFTLISVKPEKSGHVVFGCGYNAKSQLGYQPNDKGKGRPLGCLISIVPLPLPLDKSSKVLALAAGRGHSLISVEGKGILALGDNSYGQCGRNIIEDEEYFGSKYICRIPRFGSTHEDDVIQMASRFDVSICVTRGGQVYTFGCNSQGQLGRGKDVTNPWIPKPVEGDLKGERVIKVTTSGASVLALTDKGELFGWGSNDCGQVKPDEISKIYYQPVRVKLPRRIGKLIDVANGDMITFVLNEFGNVYVWGNGYSLGLGPKISSVKSPTLMPPPLFGRNEFNPDIKVVKLAATFSFAAAVNSIGDLYTWGRNEDGCLGIGKLQSDYQFFPFKVALGVPVHTVCLGVDHTVLMAKSSY